MVRLRPFGLREQSANQFDLWAGKNYCRPDGNICATEKGMQRLTNGRIRILVLGATLGGLVGAASMRSLSAQQGQRPAPPQGYITGVVRSDSVPQAGVWVIAETKDLPTPFMKIVVTDDQGRFMLPELPAPPTASGCAAMASSTRRRCRSSRRPTSLTLKRHAARTPQEAAKVYPGNYWLSLLEPPAAHEFPGNGTKRPWRRDADAESLDQLAQVRLQLLPSARQSAHAQRRSHLQGEARAEVARRSVGVAARNRRARHGDVPVLTNQGKARPLQGLPTGPSASRTAKSRRRRRDRAGIERNVVLTLWDWGTDHSFMHDEITTDKTSSDGKRRTDRSTRCRPATARS